ncbi:DNA mismatch repair enzyme [Cenarchaeum symbiosum A]|uniref:DNA mismatch repair enzyme n=1 Tax=Cenarchaeum symbiosum (strain A) TaxID=414004 RepID=A0RVA5_CENSY|nr:DNA mismatch repair enzyme [Cenarchaeum symbiosum A]
MRYGGYKNPAYAIAEIIDNSFEADADKIEIFCKDKIEDSLANMVERMHEIIVTDNGTGMTKEDLWESLRFGEGTRRARRGIGRFGMGLPYSSLSQCRRVDVYSWQKPGEVLHTYLDLDEIQGKNMRDVPEPKRAKLPDILRDMSGAGSYKSGTVVVWSGLDRCSWKKSSTMIANSEKLIGRIYRRFLGSKKLDIRMISVNNSYEVSADRHLRPNDPLYQMKNSSAPPPWDREPMFQPDGEKPEEVIKVKDRDGKPQAVTLRFAFAKKEARKLSDTGDDAGRQPHGRHANFNLGVSIVREGREIGMDQNLVITYDPVERWWGAEIEFPPALDEFFGITNNKQDATTFTAMTKLYGVESHDNPAMESIIEDDKDMAHIVKRLQARIRQMRKVITIQRKGTRSSDPKRHGPDPTDKFRGRTEGGNRGTTDEQITTQDEQTRKEHIQKELDGLVATDDMNGFINDIIENKIRVVFQNASYNNPLFFDISLEGGVAIIKMNTSHSAYNNLMSIVENIPDDIEHDEAVKRLRDMWSGLRLLIASWARLEDEESNDEKRKMMGIIRTNWGEMIEHFLKR